MLDITFEQIKAFLAVARQGSFSAAAQKNFRTQAAVSIQVARLEELLETVLFNRTTKRLELTDTGRVLFKHLTKLEACLEEAAAEISDLRAVKKGKLILSTSDTTACYYLPPLLRNFNDRYPGVEIVVHNATSPRTRQLIMENEVDLGIVTLNRIPAELAALPLFPRKDVVICHPEHPLASRKELFLKDLEQYACILLDQKCATRQIIDETCAASRVKLTITMELSSVEVIKRFVRIAAGISIIPACAVQEEADRRQLSLVQIRDYLNLKPVQMGVIYRKSRYLSFAARSFLKVIAENRV